MQLRKDKVIIDGEVFGSLNDFFFSFLNNVGEMFSPMEDRTRQNRTFNGLGETESSYCRALTMQRDKQRDNSPI